MTENVITQDNLLKFLQIVDDHFPIPLSRKVNLPEYAQKLIDRADLFAEMSETGEIQALAAGYIRHVENDMAYIAVVATLPEMCRRGMAGRVVQKFKDQCREQKRKGVHLYAVASNTSAVRMYERLRFERYYPENEQRPENLHLVH